MSNLDLMLKRNKEFAAPMPMLPQSLQTVKAVIIGCADMRVDPSHVLGIKPGEAVVMRNIGGRVTPGLLEEAPQLMNQLVPVAAVALSPVTDLSLSDASWTTRAAADPYFTQIQAAELVRSYLNGADLSDPAASPLRADLTGLRLIRAHVGDDEVLLEDSVRFVDRALATGVDAQLDVWEGMVHGFLGSVGSHERLGASTPADRLVPF